MSIDEKKLEAVAENPSVVQGGPLDPTSPEGTPPEGHTTGFESPKPQEPLHRGLTGDLKTPEELRAYTKHLEDLVVLSQGKTQLQPAQQPVAANSPGRSAKDRFAEVIYSNPNEAYEILRQDVEERAVAAANAERRQELFWTNFYESNPDLKRMQSIVQSVVREHAQEISDPRKTASEVSEIISRESRKVIDLVRKESGFTEVQVPSQNATHLGGSREPAPVAQMRATGPNSMIAEIRKLQQKGKVRIPS